jgi:hypothetical protein
MELTNLPPKSEHVLYDRAGTSSLHESCYLIELCAYLAALILRPCSGSVPATKYGQLQLVGRLN